MLLEDLFDPKTKQIELGKKFGNQKPDNKEFIGKGTASIVRPDRNDPHMVSKRSYIGRGNKNRVDGFTEYAEFIIKNRLAEKNPFFPRIYVMKQFKDSEGKTLQKYQIEKLTHAVDIEPELLQTVYFKLFGEEGETDTQKEQIYLLTRPNITSNQIHEYICREIGYAVHQKNLIKNETFLDAVNWLQKIENELNKDATDIKEDNILYRRTSQGIQLVFSDPIY